MVSRRKNINPNFNVHCCVTGCHGNSLLHLVWTKTSVMRDLQGKGYNYFATSISQCLCRARQLYFIDNVFTWLSIGLWNIYSKDPRFKGHYSPSQDNVSRLVWEVLNDLAIIFQVQKVSRSKLQLVGVTCMLLASKYEEMYAPEIADFVYITDNAYTKADIRRMECLVLKTLDFNLGKPLPLHFLRRNSKAGEVSDTRGKSNFFC